MSNHYVYILESADGRLYTGYTTDLGRRLGEHRKGLGAKFTRSFGARKIVYHEKRINKSDALRREAFIKQMSRAEKKALFE